MFEIGTKFTFAAAHHISGLGEDNPCGRQHGHGFTVEIVIEAQALQEPGFVADFGELAPLGQYIKTALDHRDLNEVLTVPPTCERVAQHLGDWYIANLEGRIGGRLARVTVREDGAAWAAFVPDRKETL